MLTDEPTDFGGLDSGPGPYDLVLAGLGACTSMTLRLYAERKALPLERVTVELSHSRIHAADCETCETKEGMVDRIERTIALRGTLDAEQRERLLEIADKCPVHRTLTSEVDIRTIERRDADADPELARHPERPVLHREDRAGILQFFALCVGQDRSKTHQEQERSFQVVS